MTWNGHGICSNLDQAAVALWHEMTWNIHENPCLILNQVWLTGHNFISDFPRIMCITCSKFCLVCIFQRRQLNYKFKIRKCILTCPLNFMMDYWFALVPFSIPSKSHKFIVTVFIFVYVRPTTLDTELFLLSSIQVQTSFVCRHILTFQVPTNVGTS